jgi:hypothetical protein
MLLAADLLIRDPTRELAWRALHGVRTATVPEWLSLMLPGRASFDRDPLALLLAGVAVALAIAYLGVSLAAVSLRWRVRILTVSVLALVVFPTLLFAAVGWITGRPFGQDGGVVQLPLAMDRLLAGQSPYGADYSDSVLGQESRSSEFWRAFGQNPILHHHAYLPGTHLVTLPFYLASRALRTEFDPRIVSTLALLFAILIAASLFSDPSRRLVAAAVVGLNPLVYWHQAFGANDLVFTALLLASARAGQLRRMGWAGGLLGLACATKQLAWPFAPFLLVSWASVGSVRELVRPEVIGRLKVPLVSGLGVFLAVVLPVALLDPRGFWGDIVAYNAGFGSDAYPLGGTPGFGIGNLLIYFGLVNSLREPFPFHFFYLLFLPLGWLMIRAQIRRGGLGAAFFAGCVALLALVFFSRVAHANYLSAFAILLPLGVMLEGGAVDAAVTPLALLGLSTTFATSGFLRSAWDAARAAHLFGASHGLIGALAPRARDSLTRDPFDLAFSAVAAGLALVCATAGMLQARSRVRGLLVLLSTLLVVMVPTTLVAWIGCRTGILLAEDDWVVETREQAIRVAHGESPYGDSAGGIAPAREAWSASFSRKPPRLLEGRDSLLPGASLLALAASTAGFPEPRAVLVLSLILLFGIVGALAPPNDRPLAWTVIGLLPPTALGAIFGAGEMPWLATSLLAVVAARKGRMALAGALGGLACSIDPRALVLVILAPLVRSEGKGPSPAARFVAGALGSLMAVVLPIAVLNPRALAAAILRSPELAAGDGLVNIAAYADLESSLPLHGVLALSPWIAGTIVLFLMLRMPRTPAALIAALWLTLTLFFARDGSGFDLGPPLILMALGATLVTWTATRSPITGEGF